MKLNSGRIAFAVILGIVLTVTAAQQTPPALPAAATSTAPVVQIPQGELQGAVAKSRNGADYFAYWGIPYAKPPGRFRAPEPPTVPGWKGVKNATVPGSPCVHLGYFDGEVLGSEDCLLLNVFTTSVYVEDEKEDLRPVIVYIHGGGFRTASSDMFGADYFMDEPVVLVTINYRLSSLGFLNVRQWSEQNETEPNPLGVADGNMGLKDQNMALRWVQENIKLFGGDPESVTIFGTSAGAASVSFHMLSPMSKGLFHNAIAASGTALCPWALSRTPEVFARELGKELNCSVTDSSKLITCLLEKDAKDIISKSRISTVWPLDPIGSFRPTIETHTANASEVFLAEEPEELLRRGEYSKVPFLVGITKNEGLSLHAGRILSNPVLTKELDENWNQIAPFTFTYQTRVEQENWDNVSTEIRSLYFGSKNISVNESLQELEDLYTDRNFAHPVRAAILYQAKESPVFPYIFDYDNGEQKENLFPGLDASGKVLHGDDSDYAFSDFLTPSNTEANEFSRKYLKVLVSFATTGRPDASILGTAEWPQTSAEQANQTVPLQWFHLNNETSLQNETVTFTERMVFWDNLMRNYTRTTRTT